MAIPDDYGLLDHANFLMPDKASYDVRENIDLEFPFASKQIPNDENADTPRGILIEWAEKQWENYDNVLVIKSRRMGSYGDAYLIQGHATLCQSEPIVPPTHVTINISPIDHQTKKELYNHDPFYVNASKKGGRKNKRNNRKF
jgi:hypothetical protein